MPRKPRITVTGDRKEIFVRKNGVVVAHAVKKTAGPWDCYRVYGAGGRAPTAGFAGSKLRRDHAADFMIGLVA